MIIEGHEVSMFLGMSPRAKRARKKMAAQRWATREVHGELMYRADGADYIAEDAADAVVMLRMAERRFMTGEWTAADIQTA